MEKIKLQETTYCDLQETTFCDINHPAIKALAKKLADGETDPTKITETIFKYVRDNLRFGLDFVQVKASETLGKGYGGCWNKALLFVALLRSNKIPTRLGFISLKREFLKLTLGEAYKDFHETENHCFALVWLNDKWIAVDATLDTRTYQKFFVPYNTPWGIDWNGRDDMYLYTENIAGPIDFFEDIDAALQQDIGYVMPKNNDAFKLQNQNLWQD